MKVYLHYTLRSLILALLTLPSLFAQDCKPTIQTSGSATFCEGDSVVLSTTAQPNTTYRWQKEGVVLTPKTDTSLVAYTSGTYTLEATRKDELWGRGLAQARPEVTLRDIAFLQNEGWIVGDNGLFMKTIDGGQTWDTLPVPHTENFTNIFFLTSQAGWIGGQNGLLLKTADGGISWTQQPGTWSGAIEKIIFFNETAGFLRAGEQLFKTTNGGAAWTPIALPDSFQLQDVSFVDADFAWIASGNKLYKTANGGENWQLMSTLSICTSCNFQKIVAINRSTLLATRLFVQTTAISKTTDGGSTWTDIDLPFPATYPSLSNLGTSEIMFTDTLTGFLVGRMYRRTYGSYGISSGAIFKTSDGGKKWMLVYDNPYDAYPNAIALRTPTQGMVVGADGLMTTLDDQWKDVYPTRTFLDLHSVGGTSAGIFAVGGRFRHIMNVPHPDSKAVTMAWKSGQDWTKTETGSSGVLNGYTLEQIKFKNDTLGWKVGYGTLQITKDGGITWKTLFGNRMPPDLTISKAYFQTDTTGWHIARYPSFGVSTLYRFSGASRTPQPLDFGSGNNPATTNLLDLQFVNDATGFITTNIGKLAKTTDGGATWQVLTVRDGKSLQRCFFVNEQIGWVISSDGLLLKTQNGGLTWIEQSSGVNTALYGIFFNSAENGYVVGEGGVLLKTMDGGEHWLRQLTHTTQTLNDVFFTDTTHGWIVGNKGTLLQLTISECQSVSEPLTVQVNPLPVQPIISVSNNSITLVSSAERGNQWFLNTNAISGATGNEYDPAESGSYTVQVTENGCQSPMSAAYVFTITSLDELPGLATVNVFPNPTQAEVYVSLKDLSGPVAIEILSLSGQQLRVQHIASTAPESNIPLDVKGLTSGTYLVKVRAGTFSKVSKVVLNR
ncbi:YCF48-related protein [Arundinibacter roseus]|uniref:T9SS type A sorting domain-containing protein n=1 Tax=Arundinibacter roseus TaxID=2070510 RepID=A0A4R4K854_9BACT|nr:YCF48-related protein [Arundinibacter roseus]TDB63750.1 T9SS type A sorting domain-containing protein [Arundinibacter roseus]